MCSARKGKKTQANIAEYRKQHSSLWYILTPAHSHLHPPLCLPVPTHQSGPQNQEQSARHIGLGVTLPFKMLIAMERLGGSVS